MKIEENWVPGSIFLRIFGQWGCLWEPEASRPVPGPPNAKKSIPILGSFWSQGGTKNDVIFQCFFGSALFRPLGAICAPKGPERVPKGAPKRPKKGSRGTSWKMRKPWRHMGRSRGGPGNHFFPEGAATGTSGASRGGFRPIF